MATDFAQSRLIPPSEIQSELTRIWDSLQGTNKMRASLFNLIFYLPKTERTPYLLTVAQKVIEKFPSRIIFITADKDTKEDILQTRVSVIPAMQGESDIACDRIEIDVSKNNESKVPFLILPHILTDLPVYLIWAEDTTLDNPLLPKLEKLASRLIFDSECAEKLSLFAQKLLKFYESSNCDIADLNWGRMESWRDLLSSTFYSPERLDNLKNSRTMQIFYNAQESASYCHTAIQSIYLQGWIACQMGWKLKTLKKEKGAFTFLYEKPNGPVEILIYPEKYTDIHPGAIVSVDLTTTDDVHFSFGRNLEMPHQVSMRFSTLKECAIPLKYMFAKAESGQSLVREISHKGTSTHFLNLLKLLSRNEFL